MNSATPGDEKPKKMGRPRKYSSPMTPAEYKREQRRQARQSRMQEISVLSTSMLCERLAKTVVEGDAFTATRITEELVARSVANAADLKNARDDVELVRRNSDRYQEAVERLIGQSKKSS